tara:strand:+ start:493 stop:807 length:315 start_codon:yes stop_codon:yes gene_type:complete
MLKKTNIDAIRSLVPNTAFSYDEDKVIDWDNSDIKTGKTQPTQAEIDAEVIKLQAEYDAQAYARNRQAEYPSLLELTVALYDEADKSAVEAKRASVKAKYPKPS